MKITQESLKWPQLDFAMRYIWENKFKYQSHPKKEVRDLVCSNLGIIEFGVGSGSSLKKIGGYLKDNEFTYIHLMGYDSWEGLPAEKEGVELFPKFGEGTYKFDIDLASVVYKVDYTNLFLRKTTFDKIPNEDSERITIAALIHIDSDLYISAYDALDWCFKNNLVVEHTLIAFDEYYSVVDGGEEKAFLDIQEKYKFGSQEIFHYLYYDKDTKTAIRQNVMEIFI
jgi:hypothetical protein